ncbi:uncharacterized protein Z518_05369 [Rhinocladiella mackenziei CBS 650.93]|uniref:F-box domain-containing protein n=1 Tax=Rhinocladiella mackenziei CBS 650.93 TaxID=1442369 RepID=A0A0D2IFC5_9EURO|nr:uncharacterized protein Z518_05369 [Rhinocladiella mackenziei CBS 650.93]KIX04499.1 hypothetical protein Z518_05369 [Rhinocladiella mackenziei CBS 650.93]
MTLRHPERLGPDGDNESDTSSEGRDDVRVTVHANLDRVSRNSVSSLLPKKAAGDENNIVHPGSTDFGPKTLTQYLRSEIDKLKIALVVGKGKGKEKRSVLLDGPVHEYASLPYHNAHPSLMSETDEAEGAPSIRSSRSVFPSIVGLRCAGATTSEHQVMVSQPESCMPENDIGHLPGEGPDPPLFTTLSDRSNSHNTENQQISNPSTVLSSTRRRSQRLAQKELAAQGLGQDEDAATHPRAGSHSFPPMTPLQSLPLSDSYSLPSASLDAHDDSSKAQLPNPAHTISQLGSPSSSRITNFEEHTKNKRKVVRDMTARSPEPLENTSGPSRTKVPPRKKAPRFKGGTPSTDQAAASSSISALSRLFRSSLSPQDGDFPDKSTHRSFITESTSMRPPRLFASERKNISVDPGRGSSSTELATEGEASHSLDGNVSDVQLSLNAPLADSKSTCRNSSGEVEKQHSLAPPFHYGEVVPELIPESVKKDFLNAAQRHRSNQGTASEQNAKAKELDKMFRVQGSESKAGEDSLKSTVKPFPRTWRVSQPPCLRPHNPRSISSKARPSTSVPPTGLQDFGVDLWMNIASFLSTQDLKILRLVNRALAQYLTPIQYRNVVINFGRSFFDISGGDWDGKSGWLPSNSMFQKYGENINQFGISFEYDLHGLTYAKPKVIEKEQVAWFGKFTWPTEQYPRYPALQAIEDLVDHNRPLLKEAFKRVTKASELGLCIDSGHGWLEGPDISDMALFNRRLNNGSRVFGKTFDSEDVWASFARNEYFKWAQQNTINETIKHVMETRSPTQECAAKEIKFLDNLKIRDIESFKSQVAQYDFDPESHVGGTPSNTGQDMHGNPLAHVAVLMQANPPTIRQRRIAGNRPSSTKKQLQWPLIFNGYNLAAETGGHCNFIQAKVANPTSAPLLPGSLTEAQAQWLMETVWAQRAFLSAYTTAVITNRQNFKTIHTLRISKLSSGLLPSLEQREFWSSLPGLKKLEIFISPDWRQEHITGDRSYAVNMPIPPAKAAQKFTEFLRLYVVKIESLHSLAIGYVGGGEHGVGIFARNQHVLPAPIIEDPSDWLHETRDGRSPAYMTKFDHIRDLRFENCWFSPWMLLDFMKKSRDTSLHSLTLESVSMLTCHDASIEQPLTTSSSNLHCHFAEDEWYREILPSSAAWVRVLDAITPSMTLLEAQCLKGYISRGIRPSLKGFRGHIQKITLNSCGYVKISLPKNATAGFNQNSAVTHLFTPMDSGIRIRKERFTRPLVNENQDLGGGGYRPRHQRNTDDAECSKRVMMNTSSPSGEVYPWLGTLTQCIHPIEKRILEQAWRMKFGWGDSLDRWAAVEDGFYEGGTGRFSGVLHKDLGFEDDDTNDD